MVPRPSAVSVSVSSRLCAHWEPVIWWREQSTLHIGVALLIYANIDIQDHQLNLLAEPPSFDGGYEVRFI